MHKKYSFYYSVCIFFILLFCLETSQVMASVKKIKFENISVEDGLSSYFVNCIYQDSRGFLWFGTKDGLNRYDGFTFIKYHSSSVDSTSISHNYVNAICEDPSNTGLWVGTRDGLDRLFPQFDTLTREIDVRESRFVHFSTEIEGKSTLSENSINCIYQDNSGSLWIGYEDGKLDQLIVNKEGEKIISYKGFNGGVINDIVEDNSGGIWFATNGSGLVKYDPLSKTFSNRLNRRFFF